MRLAHDNDRHLTLRYCILFVPVSVDSKRLASLLSVSDERPHMHAFHAYPARFSPALVAGLLEETPVGSVVFDPFAGSGTTLVEARLRGCHAWGNDLNPVATLLCRVKATPLSPSHLAAVQRDLAYLRKFIPARLEQRAEDARVYLPSDERWFAPHVYWELQTILAGIERVRNPHHRDIFLAALSAIVTRVSYQARESQPGRRRLTMTLPRKRTLRLFFETAEGLLDALMEFSRMVKGGSLRVWESDARILPEVPSGEVDCIITSPPYGGTYDYAAMHALRSLWLGRSVDAFEAGEIGPRRRQTAKGALDDFRSDLTQVLGTLRRVAKPCARLYWVIADGVQGRHVYRGDTLTLAAAANTGWELLDTGRVIRPVWSETEGRAFAKVSKHEYLMAFRAT